LRGIVFFLIFAIFNKTITFYVENKTIASRTTASFLRKYSLRAGPQIVEERTFHYFFHHFVSRLRLRGVSPELPTNASVAYN
jgi:hypothetical protein